jgi:hypothetical protein
MRDETGQRFMAMERKQDEYQNEVLSLLRGLATRGVGERGREQQEVQLDEEARDI